MVKEWMVVVEDIGESKRGYLMLRERIMVREG